MYLLRLVLFVLALCLTAAPARADNNAAFVFRTGFGERVFIPADNVGFNYLNVQNDVFFAPRAPVVFRAPGYGVGFNPGFAPVRGPVLFAVRPPLFNFRFTKIRR